MNNSNKKITILFDLDGTLVDSTEAILRCFDESFKHFKLSTPDDEDIKVLIGHPLDYMYEHLGINKDRVWDFVDVYKFHYRQRSKSMTKFLPDAQEAIKKAHSFARLGIVTTKTGSYSKILLEHMDVMKYFEVLIGREDVYHPKPHPEPILKALYQMKIETKENIWMIGDTCLDMISANDSGINSIGVLCGYGKFKDLQRCSKNLQKNTLKAINYIEKLNKANVKRF
jgi:phosphoglycolate phosphatase